MSIWTVLKLLDSPQEEVFIVAYHTQIQKLYLGHPRHWLRMGPRPNPDTKTNLGHPHDNLYPLPPSRTKLPVSLKRLNEMKNVSQWTPPKIMKTIWVKPLFQSFQPDSTLRTPKNHPRHQGNHQGRSLTPSGLIRNLSSKDPSPPTFRKMETMS